MIRRLLPRLAVIGIAALAAGLFEGVRVAMYSPGVGAGLFNLALVWGIWWALIAALATPWLIGAAGETPRISPATALAGLVCAGIGGLVVLSVGLPLTGRVSPGARAPLAVVMTLAAAIGCLGLAPALARLFDRIPRPSVPRIAIIALIALAVAGASAVMWGVDPRWAVVSLPALGAAVLVAGRRARLVGLGACALAPLALVVGLIGGYRASAVEIRGPAPNGLLLGAVVESLEATTDDDGDGHGDGFGGADCDDTNPDIHPEATEKPGNGVDENCRGGDRRPKLRRAGLPRTDKPVFKTPKPVERPFIVLLVLDSVRADHFGDADDLMPNFTALQKRGTTFTRAYTTAPSTRLAMPALMSGRWVGYTRYEERMGHYFTDPDVPVLTEALARKRYRTVSILPPFIKARLHGLGRGFTQVINFGRQGRVRAAKGRTEPLAVEDALEVLADDHPMPLFLYIHVDGGHHPYSKTGVAKPAKTPYGRYRGELARMDGDLKPLLDRLDAIAETRPVVLAVTADHGEAFGEHGRFHHGHNLHDEAMRIPLLLVSEGRIPAGQRIDTPVDLLDLGVTLAQAGGARIPGARGHSLWGLIDGKPAPAKPRPIFGAARVLWAPSPVLTSVQLWPLKLIRRLDTGEEELYDLAADPGEKVDLIETRGRDAARLRSLLFTWADGGNGPAGRRVRDRPSKAGGKRFDE